MDAQIHKLITTADNERSANVIKEAFAILDPESQKGSERVNIETISQNLYVECAEVAVNLNEFTIAHKCIQIYFNLPMISNQFLARAYLCQFQLLAPRGTNQLESLDKSIPYLIKAIEFSKQNKRYHFIIYNASVIYWKYIRAFLKTKFKHYLCASLQVIVDSLNEIDDSDYEWRAVLMKMLIECYIDSKNKEKAVEVAAVADQLIKTRVQNTYNDFFAFAISYQLFDEAKIEELISAKMHLQAIYRIETLKLGTVNDKKPGLTDEIQTELNDLYKFMVEQKLYDDSLKFLIKNQGFEHLKTKLLLKLAHICIHYEEVNLCSLVIGYLKEKEALIEEHMLEIDLIECQQIIKELRHRQEKYNKQSVKLRLDSIKRCDELIRDAIRLNNSDLIQLGCSVQWNLCLPMLQPGLRKDVRKQLQYVAECLEEIESMEWLLRCQIHFEVSKCEEEIEQLQAAEQHILKAIQLDDHKIYTEQLNHSLHRLRLRAELYKIPERLEDQVAVIIEQSIKLEKNVKLESGKHIEINTRSLLIRAADLLAKHEFANVMESETFKQVIGKLNEDVVSKLLAKSRNYTSCLSKCRGHISDRLRDLERKYEQHSKDEIEAFLRADYKERLKLWFDLAKIARKQQIWDVCRVATRFCILYDDDKLINRFMPVNDHKSSLFNKELVRNLAEAHFMRGEALIHFIRSEGIEMFERPKPPQPPEQSLVAQKQKQRHFETDPEWNEYTSWLQMLCEEVVTGFLRGIKFGITLNESWIVCQGAAYCWNYLHHLFEQRKHAQVSGVLMQLLEAFKRVGHGGEPQLLTNICNALATGLISSMLPPEHNKSLSVPRMAGSDSSSTIMRENDRSPLRKNVKAISGATPEKSQSRTFFVASESMSELKTALDVCEYALTVTNGENLADVINLKDRLPIIKTWVLAKQMLQSPIKNFGLQLGATVRVQDKFTKALVAIEILDRNAAGTNLEIKEPPTIKEVIDIIDEASPWPDKLIELQLWCRISILSNKANDGDSLRYAYSKALDHVSYFEKRKAENKTVYVTSQCLLSETCIALGEHIATSLNPNIGSSTQQNQQSNNKKEVQNLQPPTAVQISSKDVRTTLRREAANALSDACGYASRAENYELVIHAARQFWNLCLPYLKQQSERSTLIENLREILKSISMTYKLKKVSAKVDDDKEKGDKTDDESTARSPARDKAPQAILKSSVNRRSSRVQSSNKVQISHVVPATGTTDRRTPVLGGQLAASGGSVGVAGTGAGAVGAVVSAKFEDAFDDLTLRSALYGCLFQILIDKNEYDDALREMDCALNEMPRTKHRLLIYRFRIMTKAKLGLDVQMDLQKFKEESEKNLAQMYRKVALSSNNQKDIIVAYQRAIDALNSEESVWIKFEYLLELAQWLYSNEYDLRSCLDLIEWAVDIVTNLKIERANSATTSANTGVSMKSTRSKGKYVSNRAKSQQPNQNIIRESSADMKSDSEMEYETVRLVVDNRKEPALAAKFPLLRSLKIQDLQDIKQLECLIRGNVVMARMTNRSKSDYQNYLIKSFCFVQRILQQSIENGFYSIKEIQRLNAMNNEQSSDKKKQDQKGGGNAQKNKTPDVNAHKTHTARKVKIDLNTANILPATLDDWSVFDVHEEIVNAWSHEIMKKNGLNFNTISEPFLLFHYLDMLAEMLNEEGLINNQLISITCYTRLKLINLCIQLNLIQAVNFHQQALVNCIYAGVNSNAANNTNQMNAAQQVQTQNPTQTVINAINAVPLLILKLIEPDPFEISLIREEIYAYNQRKIQSMKDEVINNTIAQRKVSKDSSSILSQQNGPKPHKKQMFADSERKQSYKLMQQNNADHIRIPGEQKIITNTLSEILFKDIWVQIAELLIRNGHMQNARDFLFEALNASQNFNDESTIARAEYLLGEIALYDANYLEATHFALNAQKTPIDEKFWLNSVLLLAKSSKLDQSNKSSNEKSTAILNRALDIIEEECLKRPNKSNQLQYTKAMLTYQLANLLYDKVMNRTKDAKTKNSTIPEKVNTMRSAIFKQLSQVCKMYETSIETLLAEGYKRHTLPIIKAHSDLLRKFANDCQNIEAKHDYLIQSYMALNEGCTIATELWYDVQGTHVYTSMLGASLPIQREYISLKLHLAELLTHIFETFINEIKEVNYKNLQKDHIIKTYEEYMKIDNDLCESEQQWHTLLSKIPDEIMSNLMSCFNLSHKVKQLKCKTLYLMGRTLRLVDDLKIEQKSNLIHGMGGNLHIPMAPLTKWDNKILEFIKAEQAQTQHLFEQETKLIKVKVNSNVKMTDDGMAGSEMDPSEQQYHISDVNSDKNTIPPTGAVAGASGTHTPNTSILIQNVQNTNASPQHQNHAMPAYEVSQMFTETNVKTLERDTVKALLNSTNNYDSQAMDVLFQGLSLAFAAENKALISEIAYELIELTGRFDLQLCSQFIALYQSASNSIEIESILEKSLKDPKSSLLAGYLRQINYLKENSIQTNILNSPIVKQLHDVMKNRYVALRNLNISPDHININNQLPANYVLLSLQHNDTKTELYGTILDRVKPVQTIKNQKQQPSIQVVPPTKAMSIKVRTDDQEYYELQHQWKVWKADLQAYNLKLEYYTNHEIHKKQLIANINTSRTAVSDDQTTQNNLNLSLNPNNSQKPNELVDFEREIEARFQLLLQRTEDYLEPVTTYFQSYFGEANLARPTEKPTEKVIILADIGLFEFPLEALKLFHQNFSICSITRDFSLQFIFNRYYSEKDDGEAGGAVDDKKPQKSKMLPFKAANISGEPLPEGALVIDPVRLRYLVDIYSESSPAVPVEFHPINGFRTLTQQYSNVTSKWQGICGGTVTASLGERENMLAASNGFLFYGMERFLSYFQPAKIPVSNLNECYLLVANDLMQTSKSANRISKSDVQKNFQDINLEQPLQTAVLLSLTGIKCIMQNQWSSSLVENSNKFQHVFKEFMANQQSSGEIVRYRIAPHMKVLLQTLKANKNEDKKSMHAEKEKKEKKEGNRRSKSPQRLTERSSSTLKKTLTSRSDKNSIGGDGKPEDKIITEPITKDKCNFICYGIPDVYMPGMY